MNIDNFKKGDRVVFRIKGMGQHEYGVVTSINDKYIFVRYGNNPTSQATKAKHLKVWSRVKKENDE